MFSYLQVTIETFKGLHAFYLHQYVYKI